MTTATQARAFIAAVHANPKAIAEAERSTALLDRDIEMCFAHVVGSHTVAHLDPRLGTEQVVKIIKQGGSGSYGGSTSCEDGPYSNGKNARYWSFRFMRSPKGFEVEVAMEIRKTRETVVLREGTVTWNRLANMATFAAINLKKKEAEHVAE